MTTIRFHLAFALALAALAISVHAGAEADAPAAHVLRVSGVVEVTSVGKPGWRPARAGLALPAGATLRTGDTGRAEVALASGTVRVYENSLLRVPGSDREAERVRLDKGAALFDVTLPRGGQFHVETPEAVAAVKGTRFLVETARGSVAAGVYEGVVELSELGRDAAAPVLVREGFGAMLGEEAFELVLLDRPDPWNEWERGAPAPGLMPPPAPTAQDEGRDDPADARQAAGQAAIEAADAVLESSKPEPGAGDRDSEQPAADDDSADADARETWPADLDPALEIAPKIDDAVVIVPERLDRTEVQPIDGGGSSGTGSVKTTP
jgi:hypothetical protein